MNSNQSSQELVKILQDNSTSSRDHMLNILKAALATAPFAGGISSLITDYIPSSKQRRMEKFAELVGAELTKLKEDIDSQVITTDEFAFIFEQCFRGAAENYQNEKISAFCGILVNSATNKRLGAEEREYYLNLVSSLSSLHLRMLSFMAMPKDYLRKNQIPPENVRGGFSNFFPVAIPGVHIDAIKGAFGELYQLGLINRDKSIFSTMTSGQGLDLLGDSLTEGGKRFITFCSSYSTEKQQES